MTIPALLIQSFQTYNKIKLAKDVIDILSKKNVDKVDKVLTYVGGMTGKTLRFFKKYSDKIRESNLKIAKNKSALQNLISNAERIGYGAKYTRYFKWNESRFLKNINKAQRAKDFFIFNEIKHRVSSKLNNIIPGKRFVMSIEELAKSIYKKETWDKIAMNVGRTLNTLGSNEVSRVLNTINRVGNLHVTANGFWKHISENKSWEQPMIGPRGACTLIRMQQYKDPLVKDLYDRTFYFQANSPQTQNFSQELHSYNCTTKNYEIPIRGWFGKKVKRYTFYNVELNTILNTICRKLDAGMNYWNNYATLEAVVWAQVFGAYYGDIRKK